MANRRKLQRTSKDQAYALSLANTSIQSGLKRINQYADGAEKKKKKKEWACEACTYVNKNKLQNCEMCGLKSTRRSSQKSEPSSQSIISPNEISQIIGKVSPPPLKIQEKRFQPYVKAKVLVKFENNDWYGGEISSILTDHRIIIDYYDGESETCEFDDDIVILEPEINSRICLDQKKEIKPTIEMDSNIGETEENNISAKIMPKACKKNIEGVGIKLVNSKSIEEISVLNNSSDVEENDTHIPTQTYSLKLPMPIYPIPSHQIRNAASPLIALKKTVESHLPQAPPSVEKTTGSTPLNTQLSICNVMQSPPPRPLCVIQLQSVEKQTGPTQVNTQRTESQSAEKQTGPTQINTFQSPSLMSSLTSPQSSFKSRTPSSRCSISTDRSSLTSTSTSSKTPTPIRDTQIEFLVQHRANKMMDESCEPARQTEPLWHSESGFIPFPNLPTQFKKHVDIELTHNQRVVSMSLGATVINTKVIGHRSTPVLVLCHEFSISVWVIHAQGSRLVASWTLDTPDGSEWLQEVAVVRSREDNAQLTFLLTSLHMNKGPILRILHMNQVHGDHALMSEIHSISETTFECNSEEKDSPEGTEGESLNEDSQDPMLRKDKHQLENPNEKHSVTDEHRVNRQKLLLVPLSNERGVSAGRHMVLWVAQGLVSRLLLRNDWCEVKQICRLPTSQPQGGKRHEETVDVSMVAPQCALGLLLRPNSLIMWNIRKLCVMFTISLEDVTRRRYDLDPHINSTTNGGGGCSPHIIFTSLLFQPSEKQVITSSSSKSTCPSTKDILQVEIQSQSLTETNSWYNNLNEKGKQINDVTLLGDVILGNDNQLFYLMNQKNNIKKDLISSQEILKQKVGDVYQSFMLLLTGGSKPGQGHLVRKLPEEGALMNQNNDVPVEASSKTSSSTPTMVANLRQVAYSSTALMNAGECNLKAYQNGELICWNRSHRIKACLPPSTLDDCEMYRSYSVEVRSDMALLIRHYSARLVEVFLAE